VHAEELPKTLTEKQLLARAEEAWKTKQYEDGAVAYKTFLVRFPTHPQNHLIATRLADILREQGQLDEALHAYAKVVATYPETEGALMSQIRMAELSVAAPNLIPESMARDTMRYRPYVFPVPTLQQLIRGAPFHPLSDVARYTIGVILLHKQQLPVALAAFRELLDRPLEAALRRSVGDKFRLTLQQMVSAYTADKAYGEALQLFFRHKDMLESAALHEPALLLPVARSYAGLGLLPEASHIFQMVLASDALAPQERQQVTLEQAMTLAKSGQWDQAQTLVSPLDQFPDGMLRHKARHLLGDIALEGKRPAEAEAYFQPIETIVPEAGEQAKIFARLARVYEEQGAFGPALRASQQCVARALRQDSTPLPVAEECLFHSGALHIAQWQYREALAVYQSLLQAFPRSEHRDWILFQTAEIYQQLRETARMQETLQTLQANTSSAFWKRIVEEYASDNEWRERFQERLAQFTMSERGEVP
jgi:TolA-binding protein